MNNYLDQHQPEEIYSFNLYLLSNALYLVIVITLFTKYCLVFQVIAIFISSLFVYTSFIYFLSSLYNSIDHKEQTEDLYFKPISLEESMKEIDYKLEDNMLLEIGDMDFKMEEIEERFLR